MKIAVGNQVVEYAFVPEAYDPDIVGCDVETEEQAQKLDQEFAETDGFDELIYWLEDNDIKHVVTENTRIVHIVAKCGDLCSAIYYVNGNTARNNHGYVPAVFGVGKGDYVDFMVDLMTGKLINWNPPTSEQLDDWIREGEC